MKQICVFSLSFLLLMSLGAGDKKKKENTQAAGQTKQRVLVELFTSQG